MYSADDLLKMMKKATKDAVDASKPADVVFGKVVSTSPLKIQVEQKLILTSAQLVLSRNVTNYTVSMKVDHMTEEDAHTHTITTTEGGGSASTETHSHAYTGTKSFTVQNGLKSGEEVILLQKSGGQQYIVLDRIG